MPLDAAIDDRVALVGSGTLGTCQCLAIRPSLAGEPTELSKMKIIHAVLGHRRRCPIKVSTSFGDLGGSPDDDFLKSCDSQTSKEIQIAFPQKCCK